MNPLFLLLRPHQWLKNGFVFVGLLFGHAWNDPARVVEAVAAFITFCLLSSAVYVGNDIVDREQDRLHPEKCRRPLACRSVSVPAAMALGLACLAGSLTLAVFVSRAPLLYLVYLAFNAVYSLGAKHVVILDVFIIASGFMLRILAGTVGIGIPPSHWLLLCGLMLTLFLGFAKRRAELGALGDDSAQHRRVLEHYTPALLDQIITLAATGTVVSYALYTVSADTIALHGTNWLIVTVPCVIYGLARYLFLLHRCGGGGDPARDILTDRHLLVALFIWFLLVIAMLAKWI